MAWLAVDKDGTECIYSDMPNRRSAFWYVDDSVLIRYVKLPEGSIEKLIGRKLTWKDEPVKIE